MATAEKVKETFRKFGHPTGGSLTKPQLQTLLTRLDPRLSQQDVDNLFESMGRPEGDSLAVGDLVDWAMSGSDSMQSLTNKITSGGGPTGATQLDQQEATEEYHKHISTISKGADITKGGIDELTHCLPHLAGLDDQAEEKQCVLKLLARAQKSLLDLCSKLTDLRREIGGHDAVAEPIRAAKKQDVPKHLNLGLSWSGILSSLELLELGKDAAHHTLSQVITQNEREKARLEASGASAGRIERTELAIESRKRQLQNWHPTDVSVSFTSWGEVLERSKEFYALSCNGYDFLDVFVRPHLCREVHYVSKSLCELMQDGDNYEYAQDATWFLSHAQQEIVTCTLEALCRHLYATVDYKFIYETSNTFIWIDYTSLRQLQAADFTPEFVACIIQSIPTTVMMVDEWTNVQVASRLWCTFEILNSFQNSGQLLPITAGVEIDCCVSDAISAWETLSVKKAQTGAAKTTEARIRASLDALGKDVDADLRAALAIAFANTRSFNMDALGKLVRSAYGPVVQHLLVNDARAPELPQELTSCKKLQKLKLSNCLALKTFPEGIGALESLADLRLANCDELQELPEELVSCKKLQKLELSHCPSLTQLPQRAATLHSLAELTIGYCSRLKELPEDLACCAKLQSLRIYECDALERLPAGLTALNSLTHLHIAGCASLKELPADLGCGGSIEALRLGQKELTQLPASVCALCNLRLLDIRGCESLVELPKELANCKALATLDLRGTPEMLAVPKELSLCKALVVLVLLKKFAPAIPQEIQDMEMHGLVIKRLSGLTELYY
eukprot:TRINITY_DN14417_c0_g1_i1.p1 TRINITY_DN14417_c0_g1~~TRINITY_DN14417_c0_g1_i1.p1  ORF type:complete len:791 (-),score=159.05 TRINITY_DN14417_c0_g1_i1:158-2530(-)